MIKAKVFWDKDTIKRYVRYMILEKDKKTKLYMALYFIGLLAIVGISVIVGVLTQSVTLPVILGATLVTLFACFTAVLLVALNKYTNDIVKLNDDNIIDFVEITAQGFVLFTSSKPYGFIGWDRMLSADFNKDSVYFTTHDGLLFIIEKKNMTYGSIDELQQIVKEKLVAENEQ